MKNSLLTVMLFLGVISIEAFKVEKTSMTSVPHNQMVTIDL
jgi:hypothetical protein